jgi:5-methylcytosine-specific restriction endonuclease McrA
MTRANWHGSNWLRKDKRLAIYMRDDWRCVYCDRSLKRVNPRQRTLDHIIPVAMGGSNNETNLITCCKKCNDRKQDRHIQDFCKRNKPAIERVLLVIVKPIDRKLAKQILAGEIDLYSINKER